MNGSRFIYDSVDLLDPQDVELSELIEYAQGAARALDVRCLRSDTYGFNMGAR
jgi:hypothetical protein